MSDVIMPPPAHPSQFEGDVVLRDGGTVHIRPIRPGDAAALAEFHRGLSEESVYLRYFSPHPRLSDAEISHLTVVDYRWRMALVAVLGDGILGVARYEGKEGTTDAEVAFVVADAHHDRGIGTVLLQWLASAAREAGITDFYATTLWENQRMRAVFRDSGFETTSVNLGGEVCVRFPTRHGTAHAAGASLTPRFTSPYTESVAQAEDPKAWARRRGLGG